MPWMLPYSVFDVAFAPLSRICTLPNSDVSFAVVPPPLRYCTPPNRVFALTVPPLSATWAPATIVLPVAVPPSTYWRAGLIVALVAEPAE